MVSLTITSSYPSLNRSTLPYENGSPQHHPGPHNIGTNILWATSVLILPVGVSLKTKAEEGCCNELGEFHSTKGAGCKEKGVAPSALPTCFLASGSLPCKLLDALA